MKGMREVELMKPKKGALERTETTVFAMMLHNKNAKLLAKVETPGQAGVFLWMVGRDRYRVQYGQCLNMASSRADATLQFGGCMFHAIECTGMLEEI